MNTGKIVLGVAAAVVTVGGSLAFKTTHKFRTHKVFAKTAHNSARCKICKSLWTVANGVLATKCKTNGNGVVSLFGTGSAHHSFFTNVTQVDMTKCGTNKVISVTITA